jgi:hypothetical protein
MTTSSFKAGLNLALATLSFAICFAAWGLMSALAPYFRDLLHLDATQTALLVVVPVLLGSLARVPMGMLANRIGGRATFTGLMLVVAVPHGTRSYSLELPHPAVRDILSWTCGFLLCGRCRIRFLADTRLNDRAQRWVSTETLRARVSQSYVGRGARFHRVEVAGNSRTLWEGCCCSLRRSA